jgi:peptidyl-prolyl cis-trans isomerase D|nr:peptidylprolyl isomerase [Kofleriaceae bacterium]
MIRQLVAVVTLALAAAACGPGSKGGPTMNNHLTQPDPVPQESPVVSADIMAREPVANTAKVKHILIGWKDLTEAYQGHMDPRAAARTKAQAEDVVRAILAQLKGGADFDTLMKTQSEDPGSASSAREYVVSPDAQLVIEFRQIGTRLRVGEIGVVESDFGFHIVKRTE